MSPKLAVFRFAYWFGLISAVLGIGDDIVSITGQVPEVEQSHVEDLQQAQYDEYQAEQSYREQEYEERLKWQKALEGRRSIKASQMFNLPRTRPEPFLEKLIYPGSLLVLAASPKIGKTTFLFHALQAITTGEKFCDLKTRLATILYASEQPDPSLFTQVERVSGFRENSRIYFLPLDFNCTTRVEINHTTGKEIEVNHFPASWEEQISVWKEELERTNANILVIDTFTAFGLFKTGEAFDSGPVTTRLQQLKSLQTTFPGLAIVVCHHLRKEDEQTNHEPTFHDIANSYALTAASDMNALLWKPSQKATDENLRGIKIQGRFLEEEEDFCFRKVGNSFGVSEPPQRYEAELKLVLDNPNWWKLSLDGLAEAAGWTPSKAQRFRKAYPKDHAAFSVLAFGVPKVV